MNKNNTIIGLLLILIGLALILNMFDFISIDFSIGSFFATFWPLFILIPGLYLHLKYFENRTGDAGILLPAGVFLVVGLTCQTAILLGYRFDIMWPGFVLAPAVGLFELYLFGKKEEGLLIPVFILGGLSLIFFMGTLFEWITDSGYKQVILASIFIIIGISILFRKKKI